MHVAMEDLKLDRLFVVYPGGPSLVLGPKAELVSIQRLPGRLQEIAAGGGQARSPSTGRTGTPGAVSRATT